jgi:hypothetical protein
MNDNYYFYSKLLKYIFEKYFNPEIIKDDEGERYLFYKVVIFDKKTICLCYSLITHKWTYPLGMEVTAKSLSWECTRFAGFIGYE